MNTPPDKLKPEQMPAFPLHNGDVWGGMMLRDYFAAKALPALVYVACDSSMQWHEAARRAYEIADAMLHERSRP